VLKIVESKPAHDHVRYHQFVKLAIVKILVFTSHKVVLKCPVYRFRESDGATSCMMSAASELRLLLICHVTKYF